jgi:hypothetical protein
MRPRILGLAVVLVGALVAVFALAGQAQAGGRIPTPPLTTAPDLYVTVNVTMTNTKFVLSVHAAPRGADARFVIHNVSNKPNTFVVGKQNVGTGTGAQTGFSATVKPGGTKILILFLDIRGKIPYSSGLAADRSNPAMRGEFLIGPCTHYEQVTGVPEC